MAEKKGGQKFTKLQLSDKVYQDFVRRSHNNINTTLGDYLDQYATTYVDDILIYSESVEEHEHHVRTIL